MEPHDVKRSSQGDDSLILNSRKSRSPRRPLVARDGSGSLIAWVILLAALCLIVEMAAQG